MSDLSQLQREAPRALCLLAVLVVVAGYYGIVTRYERAINESLAASERYYSATVANERIAHESSRLVALQKTVNRDLARLRARDSIAATEQLLQVLEASGRRFDVSVLSMQPEQIAGDKLKIEGLTGNGLAIRIRGRFRGILQFIEDLPRRHPLLTIGNTEMRLRVSRAQISREPTLEATIQATTFTIQLPAEETHALTR